MAKAKLKISFIIVVILTGSLAMAEEKIRGTVYEAKVAKDAMFTVDALFGEKPLYVDVRLASGCSATIAFVPPRNNKKDSIPGVSLAGRLESTDCDQGWRRGFAITSYDDISDNGGARIPAGREVLIAIW